MFSGSHASTHCEKPSTFTLAFGAGASSADKKKNVGDLNGLEQWYHNVIYIYDIYDIYG